MLMAKVFTIDFKHRVDTYSALVTLKTKGEEQVVHVHLFDEKLNRILAGEELEFTLTNGLKRHTEKYNPQTRELMASIKEAVLEHLKSPEHNTAGTS